MESANAKTKCSPSTYVVSCGSRMTAVIDNHVYSADGQVRVWTVNVTLRTLSERCDIARTYYRNRP